MLSNDDSNCKTLIHNGYTGSELTQWNYDEEQDQFSK